MGSLTNLFAIPVATGLIVMIGFYYVTNAKLAEYGDEIKGINTKIVVKTDEDTKARDKIRDDFLAAQMKTVEGIGKLDTRLAVAETSQKTANDQLSRIADSLQRILTLPAVTPAASPAPRR